MTQMFSSEVQGERAVDAPSSARSSSQAGRADASAGRTQRPESELSGPAQLCSCLLCLAAEAVDSRAAGRAHSCSSGGFINSLNVRTVI